MAASPTKNTKGCPRQGVEHEAIFKLQRIAYGEGRLARFVFKGFLERIVQSRSNGPFACDLLEYVDVAFWKLYYIYIKKGSVFHLLTFSG